MQDLSSEGRRMVDDLAQRHDVSAEAVMTLLAALRRGRGTQAQFSHPDLGGMGQWSRGGMTMVGDMFNQALKSRVDRLCTELSGMMDDPALRDPAPTSPDESQERGQNRGQDRSDGGRSPGAASSNGGRWPAELGRPSATGSQNDLHYAFFPDTRRLAIERAGRMTIHDTGDHRIAGVSQRQSGDQSIRFTSQHGPIDLNDLPVVEADDGKPAPEAAKAGRSQEPSQQSGTASPSPVPNVAPTRDDVFGKIEQLADLHRKAVISDDEFSAKKTELLDRL